VEFANSIMKPIIMHALFHKYVVYFRIKLYSVISFNQWFTLSVLALKDPVNYIVDIPITVANWDHK